jgi:DNA polymerase-1
MTEKSASPIIFDLTSLGSKHDKKELRDMASLFYATIKRLSADSTSDSLSVFISNDLSLEQKEFLVPIFNSVNANIVESSAKSLSSLLASLAYDKQINAIKIVSGSLWPLVHISEKTSVIHIVSGSELSKINFDTVMGFPQSRVADYLSLVGESNIGINTVPFAGHKSAVSILSKIDLVNLGASEELSRGMIGKSILSSTEQIKESQQVLKSILMPETQTYKILKTRKSDYSTLFSILSEVGMLDVMEEGDGSDLYTSTTKISVVDNQAILINLVESLEKTKGFSCSLGDSIMTFSCLQGISHVIKLNSKLDGSMAPAIVYGMLKSVLENDSIKKVFTDSAANIAAASNFGVNIQGIGSDLLILSKYIYSEEKSLKDLSSELINIDLASKPSASNDMDLIRFNGQCVDLLLRISRALYPMLGKSKSFFANVEMQLATVIAKMNKNGVCLDIPSLEKLSRDTEGKIADLKVKAFGLAGREFDIGSPADVGRVLFDHLGLNKVLFTRGGVPSTSNDALVLLKDRHPLVPVIIELRTIMSLQNSNISNLLNNKTRISGRVNASFLQMQAITGRLSCRDPNLQGIPIRTESGRKLRRAFISEKGYIIAADYSQIELRVLAHLSQDPILIDAFKKDLDIHAITASQVFNVPLASVTKTQRDNAKSINFGIIYAMSAYGLSQEIGVSVKEAETFIETYFNRFPKAKEYLEGLVVGARRNGYVETISGRKIIIKDINSPDFKKRKAAERAAQNYPMQGSAADIVKKAMVDTMLNLDKSGVDANLVMQVHDELVFDCSKEQVKDVYDIVSHSMSSVMSLSVPLVADIGVSLNWEQSHTIGDLDKLSVELKNELSV